MAPFRRARLGRRTPLALADLRIPSSSIGHFRRECTKQGKKGKGGKARFGKGGKGKSSINVSFTMICMFACIVGVPLFFQKSFLKSRRNKDVREELRESLVFSVQSTYAVGTDHWMARGCCPASRLEVLGHSI